MSGKKSNSTRAQCVCLNSALLWRIQIDVVECHENVVSFCYVWYIAYESMLRRECWMCWICENEIACCMTNVSLESCYTVIIFLLFFYPMLMSNMSFTSCYSLQKGSNFPHVSILTIHEIQLLWIMIKLVTLKLCNSNFTEEVYAWYC